MKRQAVLLGLLLATACGRHDSVIVIHAFKEGLPGVRAANPEVRLELGSDSGRPGEPVLLVDYPRQGDDPAGRDVRCDVDTRDWSSGRAISFQVKPSHAMRLSVSFLDRNGVVYTSWADVTAGVWQPVRLPFADMRPNPYFQPPGATLGAPLDLSDVGFIAFAPQHADSGHLAVSRFIVER